jgi:FkbM family methyltransferase
MVLRKLAGRVMNSSLGGVGAQNLNLFLHRMGLQLDRTCPELRPLSSYGIKTVLDIGASCGDFLLRVRPFVPQAFIHSFEPLPELYAGLERQVTRDGRSKAWNLAIGEKDGIQVMRKHDGIFMSSFLPMTECTVQAYPDSVDWTPQEVKITSLDKWAESQKLEHPMLVKMDVQGYERQVFQGGIETIKKADLLLTEVSFKGLYEGEWLFDDLYRVVRDLGFSCIGTGHPTADKTTGRSLQNDVLFARES